LDAGRTRGNQSGPMGLIKDLVFVLFIALGLFVAYSATRF
jgi:hypothetical protein